MRKFLIILIAFFLMPSFAMAGLSKKELEHNNEKISYLNLEWWEKYNDEILIEHLKQLYERNYDLKNADLKIKQNEKLVRMELAQELPSITFDGYLARDFRSSVQQFGSLSIPSYAQNNFQLPLTMSYEVDIWGKNRLKTKSMKQQLEVFKQAERASYISLTSDFTADYFNLIKTDKLISIQDELIKLQEDIVSKIKDKYDAGLCSIAEVYAEQKLLTVLKEDRNSMEDKREVLQNGLKVYLAGEENISRADYDSLTIPLDVPTSYSSELITERPDFLQQEANMKKAGFDVKTARRELLPSFVIFGQIGLNSYHFGDLFKQSTQLANAGIVPVWDLFAGGRKKAFLQLRKYIYEEAVNSYQKTILEDIKELNNAVSDLKTAGKNYSQAQERLDVQDKIYNLIADKEVIGSASKLDVLYGKEAYLMVEKEKVSNAINYMISTISLYKACGGKDLYKTTNL